MNATYVIWWGYVSFAVLVALFMLYFSFKIREKGG